MAFKQRCMPNNWSQMPENVSHSSSKRTTVWFVQNEMYSTPTTRNDLKIQGFMGIRRPVLACDSLLFFMHGKPSITTLTQSKPQSGLMLIFSCFSCFSLTGSSSSREGKLQKKAETSQTRLIAVKSFRISCDYCQTL